MAENFTRALYLDKKERIRMFLRPRRIVSASVALLIVVVLPIWPEYVHGPFVISTRKVPIRAVQPGTVVEVGVHEGEEVRRGTTLLRLRNLDLQSQADEARANLQIGTAKAVAASQRYDDFASAESDRRHLEEDSRVGAEKAAQLEILSPISATVLTPRTADLVGRNVDDGDLLLELADTSTISARVYLPEFSMRELRLHASVRMLPRGQLSPLTGTLDSISPVPAVIPPGLMPKESLEGIAPPSFYIGEVQIQNSGELKEGTSGLAKVLVGKSSLASLAFKFTRDLVQRKVW
jgi:multidrug efflux pump subunit AcrA (membrane-fusion protein)